jgi:hypothetical protein
MNARDAIKLNIESAQMVYSMYLEDLSDKELLHRPCKGANHINWQVGHLIVAEHGMIDKVSPGTMPPLPAGFAERYTKETSTSDNPEAFCSKAELLAVAADQRKGTMAALAKVSDADLDKPTGMDYAPNVAAVFSLQGGHWMMHAGQWAVTRRQLGRPPLF